MKQTIDQLTEKGYTVMMFPESGTGSPHFAVIGKKYGNLSTLLVWLKGPNGTLTPAEKQTTKELGSKLRGAPIKVAQDLADITEWFGV